MKTNNFTLIPPCHALHTLLRYFLQHRLHEERIRDQVPFVWYFEEWNLAGLEGKSMSAITNKEFEIVKDKSELFFPG